MVGVSTRENFILWETPDIETASKLPKTPFYVHYKSAAHTSTFSMSRSLVSRVCPLFFIHRALPSVLVSLLSTGFLFALWMSCLMQARCRLGFERRVDAAIYRSGFEDQNAHAVIGTRCRRNG